MSKIQKYKAGDLVMIAKDLGDSMFHFKSGCEAIVIGSYSDQFGGEDTDSYTLYIKGTGESSWYYEEQLSIIESGMFELLQKWKCEVKSDMQTRSDLDWIFKNGSEVIENGYTASISALSKCLGVTSLWGNSGEGATFMFNCLQILDVSTPYLVAGDKNAWLDFCEKQLNTNKGA